MQKNRFPKVLLEITVRSKVPSEGLPVEISFLTLISKGTQRNHILLRIGC
jgi:hypothetical protein